MINLERLSKEEILKMFKWRCPKHGHTGLAHQKCYIEEKKIQPVIYFLDLECSNLKATYGIILTWAIKELGKKEVYHDVITKKDLVSGNLDKRIVKSCVDRIKQCDVVVTHWGVDRRFDLPFLRTRALTMGIDFPEQNTIRSVDTWDMAKNKLCLHSNRQDVLAETLHGSTEKTKIQPKHWIAALSGDKKALEYILHHNICDIHDLEKNYVKLKPFYKQVRRSI